MNKVKVTVMMVIVTKDDSIQQLSYTTPEVELASVMKIIILKAKQLDAVSIPVPFNITIGNKTISVGESEDFKAYAAEQGIKIINKTNKEEQTMNKETVKPEATWVEEAKNKLKGITEDIKAAGIDIKAKDTDTILEELENALNNIIKRGKAMFAFKIAGKKAETDLVTLKEIIKEAKEKKWTETLKAIALWVCRKVWALTKGIGMFTWDTLVYTLYSLFNYGKGVIKLAEVDIITAVKTA